MGSLVFGWKSIRHYWRSSLAVIAAVAVATAVLTGALLVGSSMRGSLRDLALGRLGKADVLILSEGFFRESLARETSRVPAFRERFPTALPAILLPAASAESGGDQNDPALRVAGNLAVWGVSPEWQRLFRDGDQRWPIPGEDEAVLTGPLAGELGISEEAVAAETAHVTLRFARPGRLPGDSALGRRRDLTVSLVRLKVIAIADDRGIGGIAIGQSQAGTRNAFVSLRRLQTELEAPAITASTGPQFANVMVLPGKPGQGTTSAADFAAIRSVLPVQPADLGIEVRPVELKSETESGPAIALRYTALSTGQLVFSPSDLQKLKPLFPEAVEVSAYLANSLRRAGPSASGSPGEGAPAVVPYSMVAGTDIEALGLVDPGGQPIGAPGPDGIVLNEWAARELAAAPGDLVKIRWFEPESTHGQLVEREADLRISAVCRLTAPAAPFRMRGRTLEPARFDQPPTAANDPDLTPHVPGMTDSASIENWDVPFPLVERVRPEDDDYWANYRTTPKAFVSLETARRLWSSRFGVVTGLRIPDSVSAEDVEKRLANLWQSGSWNGGLQVLPVRAAVLSAAGGSTPFDALFLALSMFIIAAALLLVFLLFRLGLDSRAVQIGTMAAVGFPPMRIAGLWLGEAVLLALAGAALGAWLGVGWAALMIHGLGTWWVGAIGRPFLSLHIDRGMVLAGAVGGMAAALASVGWGVWTASRQPATELLVGRMGDQRAGARSRPGPVSGTVAAVLLLAALAPAVAGQFLQGDHQAGAFLAAGGCALTGLLIAVWRRLRSGNQQNGQLAGGLSSLAWSSVGRNPVRSMLTIALVAVATFLVVAVSAFRLSPENQSTGGVLQVATTSQPIFDDLNDPAAQDRILGPGRRLDPGLKIWAFRLQPGEDASCNNVYQTSRPQVLGVPESWIRRFDEPGVPVMRWAARRSSVGAERDNPWRMLLSNAPGLERDELGRPVVDCVLDRNTAWYSLKVYTVGSLLPVRFDSGEEIVFRVAGLLENSLLQGGLLIGEAAFRECFPLVSGYRYFLMAGDDGARGEGRDAAAAQAVALLETALRDQGFDAQPARQLLERFMSVQNTYISAFQALGGLGLLLGTAGLAAVMMRNVVQRRKELAVLQCLGFTRKRVTGVVLGEQAWLLAGGLGVGLVAAFATVLPHLVAGGASVPWRGMALIAGGVALTGLLTALLVARRVLSLPVVASLRSE